jgi:hypothetical protein
MKLKRAVHVQGLVKICFKTYLCATEEELTNPSYSIVSKIDDTSTYISIRTQVIHLF